MVYRVINDFFSSRKSENEINAYPIVKIGELIKHELSLKNKKNSNKLEYIKNEIINKIALKAFLNKLHIWLIKK
jgi:hypothetical protein